MTKGWNFDYLNSMAAKYEELERLEQDEEFKVNYGDLKDKYLDLSTKLLIQQGKTTYDKVTTEDFLSMCNGANNLHIYSEYYDRLINKFTLKIENLPRIVMPNYKRTISKDESYGIVGDFIKYYFGDEGYEIYKRDILKKPEYILYNHIDELSDVTLVGDEEYIYLVDHDDIRFTSALAHEAGHIAKSSINKTSPYDLLLGEFDSFSYQIRLLIFMINKGIYQRDALKELLRLMDFAEKILIIKYYNNKYKLNNIKDPNYFNNQIEKLGLKEKSGIKDDEELYDSIYSILIEDFIKYIYSLLAVFGELDNPDYLKTYYDVIANMGIVEHKKLVRRNNISINKGINNYLELRNELVNKL